MAVVLEFPWFTTFVIKVITVERSDAGAEEAADTLEGATVETELGSKVEAETG